METHSKDNDSITALATLYQAETTAASVIFNTAMDLTRLTVAYMIGAVLFVRTIGNRPTDGLLLLLLPIPIWLIATFNSLVTLNAMRHGVSVKILEDALFAASGLRVKRDHVGSAAGDKIMDITQARFVHKLATMLVYGGVGSLMTLVTAYSLYSAQELVRSGVIWTAAISYMLVGIIVAASWIAGLRVINDDRDSLPVRRKRSGADEG
jgi:hypothetical protein